MIKTTKELAKANAITHGGTFHADEVMASVILHKVFGYLNVLRTFKVPEDVVDEVEVVVYDIGLGAYDHHQKGGNGARDNGILYASAGLIWREFGHELVSDTSNPEWIWNFIDKVLIQGIDAVDNGQKLDSSVQVMTVSQIISGFNPNWDSTEDPDEAFVKAVTFAETIFDNVLANAIAKANAQEIVEEAINKAEGHIMVLDQFAPWQEIIFETDNKKADEILFVVFPSNRGGYNWQCVPTVLGGFAQRKPVPNAWKGLNGEELQKVTGVATANFCHPAGFIGSAETLDDAILLAKLAVKA